MIKINEFKHRLINLCTCFSTKKNEIMLESFPDFSCNTYELFRYMIENGVQEKYKLVWLLHDKNTMHDDYGENVEFIELSPQNKLEKIKSYRRKYNARAVISCNSFFPKYTGNKKQLHFYLDHSSQLKDMRINGKRIDLGCDYYFSQSSFFVPYHIQQYEISKEQIICTGLPRFDQFHKRVPDINGLIKDYDDFNKVIIWVPTFRKHYKSGRVDCDINYPFGVPVLYQKEELEKLIQHLEKNKVLLIVKPHPAQDVTELKKLKSKFLRVIYNSDLMKNDIQINELLTYMDAMITDYSSIYYDYLELKRPIAVTLDDYKSYGEQKGFVFDNMLDVIKGEYVYDVNDLMKFVSSVATGEDSALNEREKIRKMINDYNDGDNSKRVMEFILKTLEKQKGIFH